MRKRMNRKGSRSNQRMKRTAAGMMSLLLCAGMPTASVPAEEETAAEETEAPIVYTSGDYKYVLLEDGTAQISAWRIRDESELEVPSSLDGYEVSSIGERAFYNCDSLSSITLPDGLESIGDEAFRECNSLSSITPPEGLESIGSFVFYGCSENLSFTVVRDSYGAQYVLDNGYSYIYTDSLDWLNE